jgi:gas vesicle protein/phage tail protein X
MGKEPGQIREEIEQTRTDMGDTVDALGYKADVKTRAKEGIADKRDRLKERITGATPDSGEVKEGAQRAVGVAQENPIGLALGSVAVGFVAGMLIPSTRVENEKIGPAADQVKEGIKETGQEALERGKEVAQEAAESAKQTVQERGGEQADQLRESAQEKVDEARQSTETTPQPTR